MFPCFLRELCFMFCFFSLSLTQKLEMHDIQIHIMYDLAPRALYYHLWSCQIRGR